MPTPWPAARCGHVPIREPIRQRWLGPSARRLCGCADANDADRIRETHRRRNSEMGQSDPGGQHQGRLTDSPVTPIPRTRATPCRGIQPIGDPFLLRNGAARRRTGDGRNCKSGATHPGLSICGDHAVIKATLRRKSAWCNCEIFDFNLLITKASYQSQITGDRFPRE